MRLLNGISLLLTSGNLLCMAVDPPPPPDNAIDLGDRKINRDNCTRGIDLKPQTGDLCQFTCALGVCEATKCECIEHSSEVKPLPAGDKTKSNIKSYNSDDSALNNLCGVACRYGHCPADICDTDPTPLNKIHAEYFVCGLDSDGDCVSKPVDQYALREKDRALTCAISVNPAKTDVAKCERLCKPELDKAKADGALITNYGCIPKTETGMWPINGPDPFINGIAPGRCVCNSGLVNELAGFVFENLAALAEIGCFIFMRAFESLVKIGLKLFPEIGEPIELGLDAITTTIQTFQYLYPDSEGPKEAFDWWLSPCGDTSLVPDDLKKAFDIVDEVSGHLKPFKAPKGVAKHSGKLGDKTNPFKKARLAKAEVPGPPEGREALKKVPQLLEKCEIPKEKQFRKIGVHTVRELACADDHKTTTTNWVVTSINYPTATSVPTVMATATCSKEYGQACHHYSSAIRQNSKFATVTCPPDAGTTAVHRDPAPATVAWQKEHSGQGWLDLPPNLKDNKEQAQNLSALCDKAVWPPSELLDAKSPDFLEGGKRKDAQLVRFIPRKDSRLSSKMWSNVCFTAPLQDIDGPTLKALCEKDKAGKTVFWPHGTEKRCKIDVDKIPVFTITEFQHDKDEFDGLTTNSPCWPSAKVEADPGFALLGKDAFYDQYSPQFDYSVNVGGASPNDTTEQPDGPIKPIFRPNRLGIPMSLK
ncbi:hypothetical protein VHEMI08726 [[Torrubiella] hemipterigena]|uniref:Uncharacterized protein n=1 Tax=[Torrubiella] hemipterigena TaxID=1531966 RepID=A0A0A1TP15_9HYPO|nr:hypothetical protein VHEMI08726 [[Torrubiella] hemipterigena]